MSQKQKSPQSTPKKERKAPPGATGTIDLSKTYTTVPVPKVQKKMFLTRVMEKYSFETSTYMLEPWERYLLNFTFFCLLLFVGSNIYKVLIYCVDLLLPAGWGFGIGLQTSSVIDRGFAAVDELIHSIFRK